MAHERKLIGKPMRKRAHPAIYGGRIEVIRNFGLQLEKAKAAPMGAAFAFSLHMTNFETCFRACPYLELFLDFSRQNIL